MKQCENGHFYDEGRHETCPYCAPGPTMGKTVAVAAMEKTLPLGVNDVAADRGKTVGLIKKEIGIDPAVGFVVSVSGPHKGMDFRLHSGRNFIGRTAGMDVSLADDDTVSRENHCTISYDNKHNEFTLSPGTGRGITYRNDAPVEIAQKLAPYDLIEIGKTSLLFLPLCGERFRWGADEQ